MQELLIKHLTKANINTMSQKTRAILIEKTRKAPPEGLRAPGVPGVNPGGTRGYSGSTPGVNPGG